MGLGGWGTGEGGGRLVLSLPFLPQGEACHWSILSSLDRAKAEAAERGNCGFFLNRTTIQRERDDAERVLWIHFQDEARLWDDRPGKGRKHK